MRWLIMARKAGRGCRALGMSGGLDVSVECLFRVQVGEHRVNSGKIAVSTKHR